MSEEELAAGYDWHTRDKTEVVDSRYYLDELARRESKRHDDTMRWLTRVIAVFTLISTVAVIVSTIYIVGH